MPSVLKGARCAGVLSMRYGRQCSEHAELRSAVRGFRGPGWLVFWRLREQRRGAWPTVTTMWRWQVLCSSCFVVLLMLQTRNWPTQTAPGVDSHLISPQWAWWRKQRWDVSYTQGF